LIQYSFKLS